GDGADTEQREGMIHLVADADLEREQHVGHESSTQTVGAEGAECDADERRCAAESEEDAIHRALDYTSGVRRSPHGAEQGARRGSRPPGARRDYSALSGMNAAMPLACRLLAAAAALERSAYGPTSTRITGATRSPPVAIVTVSRRSRSIRRVAASAVRKAPTGTQNSRRGDGAMVPAGGVAATLGAIAARGAVIAAGGATAATTTGAVAAVRTGALGTATALVGIWLVTAAGALRRSATTMPADGGGVTARRAVGGCGTTAVPGTRLTGSVARQPRTGSGPPNGAGAAIIARIAVAAAEACSRAAGLAFSRSRVSNSS